MLADKGALNRTVGLACANALAAGCPHPRLLPMTF
jgi:hypothetical protein